MSDHSFGESARALAHRYVLPDAARDLFVHVGDLLDGDLAGLDLVFVNRAFSDMMLYITKDLRPLPLLNAQLEAEKARNELRESTGIETSGWTQQDSDIVQERWELFESRNSVTEKKA